MFSYPPLRAYYTLVLASGDIVILIPLESTGLNMVPPTDFNFECPRVASALEKHAIALLIGLGNEAG